MGENIFEQIGSIFTEKSERSQPDLPSFEVTDDFLKATGLKSKEQFAENRKKAYDLVRSIKDERKDLEGVPLSDFFQALSKEAHNDGRKRAGVFFDGLSREWQRTQGEATAKQFEDTGDINGQIARLQLMHDFLSGRAVGLDKATTKPLAMLLQKTGLADTFGIEKQYQGAQGVERAQAEAQGELQSTLAGRAASTFVNIYGLTRGLKAVEGVGAKMAASESRLPRIFAAVIGAQGVLPKGGRLSSVVNSAARFATYEGYRTLGEHADAAFATLSRDPSKWADVLGETLKDTGLSWANGGFVGAAMPMFSSFGRALGARLSGLANPAREHLLQKGILGILKEGEQGAIKNAFRTAVGRFFQGTAEGAPLVALPQFGGFNPNDPNAVIDGFLGGVPSLFSDDPKERQRGFEATLLNTFGMGLWNVAHLRTPIGGQSATGKERTERARKMFDLAQQAKDAGAIPEEDAKAKKKGKYQDLNLSQQSIETLGTITPREYRMIVDAFRETMGKVEYNKLPDKVRAAYEASVLQMVATIDLINKKKDPNTPSILEGLREKAKGEAIKDMDNLYKLDFEADDLEARLKVAAADPAQRQQAVLLKAALDNVRQQYIGEAKKMGPEFTAEATKRASELNAEGRQIKEIEDTIAKVEAAGADDGAYLLSWMDAVAGKGAYNENDALRQVVDGKPEGMLRYLIQSSPDWQKMGRAALADPQAASRILDYMKRGVATMKADYTEVADRVKAMQALGDRMRAADQAAQAAKAEKQKEAAAKTEKKKLLGKKKVVTEKEGTKAQVPASPDEKAEPEKTLRLDEATGTKIARITQLFVEGKINDPEYIQLYDELSKAPALKGLLDQVMQGKVALAEERRGRETAEQQAAKAEEEKRTDAMTGLPNRRALDEFQARLDLEQRTGTYDSSQHHYIFLDGANLGISDKVHGSDKADEYIKTIADRLRAAARVAGLSERDIFRRGGDEFVVAASGKGASKKIKLFMEQLEALGLDLPDFGGTIEGKEFKTRMIAGAGATPQIAEKAFRDAQTKWKVEEAKAGRHIVDKGGEVAALIAKEKEARAARAPKAKEKAPAAPATGAAAAPREKAPEQKEKPKVLGQTAKPEVEPIKPEEVGKDADFPDDIKPEDVKKHVGPLRKSIKLLADLEKENPAGADGYRKRADYLRQRMQKAEEMLKPPPPPEEPPVVQPSPPPPPTPAPTTEKPKGLPEKVRILQAEAQARLKAREAADRAAEAQVPVEVETVNEPPGQSEPPPPTEPPPLPDPSSPTDPVVTTPPEPAPAKPAPKTKMGKMIAKFLKRSSGKAVPPEVIKLMHDALDLAESGKEGSTHKIVGDKLVEMADVNPLDLVYLSLPDGEVKGMVLAVGGRTTKGEIAQGGQPGRRILILTDKGVVSKRIADVVAFGPEDAATMAQTLASRATEDGFIEVRLDNLAHMTNAFVTDLDERRQMNERGTGGKSDSTRRRKWLFGLKPGKKGGSFEPRTPEDKFTGSAYLGTEILTNKDGSKRRVAKVSEERELSALEVAETEAAARAKRLRDGEPTPDDYALEALAALHDDARPMKKKIPNMSSRGRDTLGRQVDEFQGERKSERRARLAQEREERAFLEEAQTAWFFDPTGRPMDLKDLETLAPLIEATKSKSQSAQEWLDAHPPTKGMSDEAKAEWNAKWVESRRYDRFMRNRQLWLQHAEETVRDQDTAFERAQSLVWVQPSTLEQMQSGQDGLVALRAYDSGGRTRDLGLYAVRLGEGGQKSVIFRPVDEAQAQAILSEAGINEGVHDYVARQRLAQDTIARKGVESMNQVVNDRDEDGNTTTIRLDDDVLNRRLRNGVQMVTDYVRGKVTRKQMEAEGFRVEHLDAIDDWVVNQPEPAPDAMDDFMRQFQDWFMRMPKRAPRVFGGEGKRAAATVKGPEDVDAVGEAPAVESAVGAGERTGSAKWDISGGYQQVDTTPEGIGIQMVREAELGLDPISGQRVVRSEKGKGKAKEVTYKVAGGPKDGTVLMSVNPWMPWVPGASKAIGKTARWFESKLLDGVIDYTWETGIGALGDIGRFIAGHALEGLSHLPGFSPSGFARRSRAMSDWLKLTFTELDPDGSIRAKMNELHGRMKVESDRFMQTLEGLHGMDPKALLEMFIEHDGGGSRKELAEYQKIADELLDFGQENGWFKKEDVEHLRGRYIPRSRWLWNQQTAVEMLGQLRFDSQKYSEQMKDALDKLNKARAADKHPDIIKRLTNEAKTYERAMENTDRLIRKIEKGGARLSDRLKMEVRNIPLESLSSIREVQRLRKSGRLKQRQVETLAEAIGNGNLDVRQPLYLLIDGLMPEIHAKVAQEWWKEVAATEGLVMDKAKAPANWIEVTMQNVIGDKSLEPLLGKAVHPQLMDWYQISNPTPDGPVRAWMRSLENSIKLTLTAYNPANWLTQEIGNSTMMLGAGLSFLDIPDAQANGFLATFGKGKWGKNYKKYLKLNFVDVASDADREFVRDLERHYGASILEARHPMVEFKEALKAAMEGKWRLAGQSFDLGSAQLSRKILRVYRMLDGAARIGTYEKLIEQGVPEAEARDRVYSMWDVTHVSRWTKYARRGLLFGNSFASIAHTMFRNPKMVYKGTVKGTLGMMLMSQINSLVWSMMLGKNRDEIEEELSWSVPHYGDFSRWWQTKTAFWTPWGTINLGKYLPLGTALDYLPGMKQIFFGGRDEQGQTFWGDIANKAAGGGNVLTQPASEYIRNRDRFGNAVQHRYDTDNILGWSYGLLAEYTKNGVLPMAVAKALSPVTGVLTQPAAQALFVGRPTQVISRAMDATSRYNTRTMGGFSEHGILKVDEKRSGVEREGIMQYLLRAIGLNPQQPSVTRRIQEETAGTEGVQKSDKGGYELTTRALKDPTSERTRLAKQAVDRSSQASEVERGMLLLGMLKSLDDGNEGALDDMKERFRNINSLNATLQGMAKHSPLMAQEIGLLIRKHQIRSIFGRLPGAREVRGR